MEVNKVDNVFEKVREVIMEQLGIEDESSVTMTTTFIDDLGADSLDVVELIMALEEEFGIEVSEDEAVALRTVGDIVAVIDSKK